MFCATLVGLVRVQEVQLHKLFIAVARGQQTTHAMTNVALHGKRRIPALLANYVTANAGQLEGRVVSADVIAELSIQLCARGHQLDQLIRWGWMIVKPYIALMATGALGLGWPAHLTATAVTTHSIHPT